MNDTESTASLRAESSVDRRAQQIRAEQIKACLRNAPVVIIINLLTASVVITGLSNEVPRAKLLIWGGVLLFLMSLGTGLYIAHRRRAIDSSRRLWALVGLGGCATLGLIWGAAGIFLLPAESLGHQLLLLFAIGGLTAGAVPAFGAYLPAVYAYIPVSLVPICVGLLLSDVDMAPIFGVLTLIYGIGITGVVFIFNKEFIQSLNLQFQNADLARALAEQRDEADRANNAKSKFLAAASHDLRQPLHALSLFASALSGKVNDPQTIRIVENINLSVRAQERLFSALLDISRLDAGVLQPEFSHFHLRELLGRLVLDFSAEVGAKGLTIICGFCDYIVRGDMVLLERILRNYLSNAIRYTRTGRVQIECVKSEKDVQITVIDTGVGIPQQHQREIFDEFYQLENPERDRNKGLGLGLAIVARVALLLNHRIGVDSAEGRGSRFFVSVPQGDPEQVALEVPDERQFTATLDGLLIVVIDDEISVREGMRTLLEQWGCQVVPAGSQDQAVQLLQDGELIPEAVVTDFRLRDNRNGIEAIERLRSQFGSNLPALIITGDTAAERLRLAKAGNYQLIHKPLQPAKLRAFLRNVHKRRRG